jgi:hypothetical protein
MQSANSISSTMPIGAQIEALVKDVPGWTPIDQLVTLFTLALSGTDKDGQIVEVGSWCGRSAAVLGLAAMRAGDSHVHCIDLFPDKSDWKQNADGTYSFAVEIAGKKYGGYEDATVWKEVFETQTLPIYERYFSVLDCFNETIASRGLSKVVHPHKGDLGSFLAGVDDAFKCRMAFLDGDHGYDAVCSDIKKIGQRLVPGGWICFDDAFSTYEGVDRAIRELVIDNPDYEAHQQMTRKLFIARRKRKSNT